MFAKYGHKSFPFIKTLDNFYAKQHLDGFICREIRESDGGDQWFRHDPASTGPNIMAWTEWQVDLQLAIYFYAKEKYVFCVSKFVVFSLSKKETLTRIIPLIFPLPHSTLKILGMLSALAGCSILWWRTISG